MGKCTVFLHIIKTPRAIGILWPTHAESMLVTGRDGVSESRFIWGV
jgi:hypothetical protein